MASSTVAPGEAVPKPDFKGDPTADFNGDPAVDRAGEFLIERNGDERDDRANVALYPRMTLFPMV
jgi:hypothetical protein